MIQNDHTENLNEKIDRLQKKQKAELIILKEHFQVAYESLKPVNLIKSAFTEITESPEIKNNLLNTTIGVVSGYLTRKIFFGATRNPFVKLAGFLFQGAISNVIAKHSDSIKSVGENIVKLIKERKNRSKETTFNEQDIYG